jgi:Acetyltransferase (GNAT) domain
MTVNLKIINPENDPRWDEFVDMHPHGSIYHHSAWRQVLLSTYGYTPFYIALENSDTGRFEGILPFLLIKSRITGNRLVSLPFTSYCPILIPESKLEEVVRFALGQHPRVDYLELKFLQQLDNAPAILQRQSAYMTHILDLGAGQELLFQSFHNSSIRQRIKRAEKNQIKLKMGESEEDLKKFYKLHMTTRKMHGLPPHPYDFFANMWHILKPKGFMLVPLMEHQGQVIAGAIVFRYKNTFIYEYSASDQNKLTISPNQLLIWEVIKIACSEGARFFDFGRSSLTNQTLINFKSRWGAHGQDLMYYYYPKANRIDIEGGFGRQILNFTNRLLPCSVLRLEGELFYPHLG